MIKEGGERTIAPAEDVGVRVRPRSLADVAWMELRERILTGKLRSGEPLALKEVANWLGLSIMPVREALQRLHQDGLVVHEPQRGTVVAPLSLENMEDVYQVRIELEGMAVELAAKRFNEQHYEELRRLIDGFVEDFDDGELTRARELHRQFHLSLYAVAGSPTLNRLIRPLIDASERYQYLTVEFHGPGAGRRAEHEGILDVCMRRDGKLAREAVKQHLSRSRALLRDALKSLL